MDTAGLTVNVVQLDDSWQQALGGWEPSSRFPNLPVLADQVAHRWRALGLWLTLFTADVRSAVVAEHPDWWIPDLIARGRCGRRPPARRKHPPPAPPE